MGKMAQGLITFTDEQLSKHSMCIMDVYNTNLELIGEESHVN